MVFGHSHSLIAMFLPSWVGHCSIVCYVPCVEKGLLQDIREVVRQHPGVPLAMQILLGDRTNRVGKKRRCREHVPFRGTRSRQSA
jgi:hypothetical protein